MKDLPLTFDTCLFVVRGQAQHGGSSGKPLLMLLLNEPIQPTTNR